ncbi:phage tail assembly protein [Aliarcobacter cryaerophilus]|uniref:phage tail assembly protein n=1 Tax=Aliarcobacter cryaerophilus TaxID=28198 RepID=UPI0021B6C81B|nr:phage tail assembly protein [Aliarcobacter cryaerophilus]MCT7405607.1 phage tail assembly protein [Aliarcobacter cryaerophilus]MCT7503450.1 phage tail assembly protein [Aliarcobacter cryaerophilus]
MKKIELSNGKTVEMREPKVKDVRAVSFEKNEEERTYLLISNLTGISNDELNELSFKDFRKLDKELQGFF